MRDPCPGPGPFLAPTRWFTPKAIRVTVQLKLRAAVGGKKKKKKSYTQWTCRCMQITTGMQWANEQRFLGMRLEIGDWGIGDQQQLQLQLETQQCVGIVACFTSHMRVQGVPLLSLSHSFSSSVSLPTRVGLMLAAALRSSGKDNNSNNTKMNHQ